MPDLKHEPVVVTGANSGLGYHATREFARHGAQVVLAAGSSPAGAAACQHGRSR